MEYTKKTINKEGTIYFYYKFSALREFYKRGIEFGDVGMLIVKRTTDNMITYKGFGTIEHPFKEMMSMTMKFNEFFDISPNRNRITTMKDYHYELIDLSGKGENRIIKC